MMSTEWIWLIVIVAMAGAIAGVVISVGRARRRDAEDPRAAYFRHARALRSASRNRLPANISDDIWDAGAPTATTSRGKRATAAGTAVFMSACGGLPLDRVAEIETALAQHRRPRTDFDIADASPPLTGKHSLA